MKIYSWNVNGIRAACKNGFLTWVKKTQPDILCLQETKAQEADFPDEVKNLKGYHFYHSSAEKKGYSGVAVLCKEKPKKVIDKIGIQKFDNEGRFLYLKFAKINLFNTYFPHTQRELKRLDFKLEFNQAYLKFVNKIKTDNLILTGDFNVAHNEIDLKNPKQNEKNAGFLPEERKFVDQMIKQGWVDTFRHLHPNEEKYSWWSYRFSARQRNIGWRIDYFFVSQKMVKKIKQANILNEVLGSDHCPVMIEI